MKAKFLFYSLALAGTFAACTQDEMFDAPALNNEVADRPVVGAVTFVNGDVESRYNSEAADFENGDKLGLYLMDEFKGYEATNANETLWKWQSCWWSMYSMVDYINTNYGYVYNEETDEWINRASQLVEGNYIAMFPQNTRATNRQDLWHPINANVDLVDHSSTPRYYVNRENQFFLGYEQLQRDQKAGAETGELTANVTMKPILTYAKMYFENQSANDFKIKKVVFKAPGGKLLPNVAFVRPSEIVTTDNHGHVAPWWAWTNGVCTNALKETLYDECGEVIAQSKYDRTTFTHAAARSMVEYFSTADRIPYGMTEAEAVPTYEYVFNFPADADILKSNQSTSSERICGISIALPAFEFEHYDWQDMEVVVYGEMWDPTINFPEGGWRPGIIRKLMNNDNGIFTLDQLKLWTKDANMNIPSVTCRIDDEYFYQNTELRVSTTKDLYDLIEARLSNASNTSNVYFDVQHYGNGLEITDEVVELITNYEKAHNVNVVVTFNNQDQVKTPIIFKTNAIDLFEYNAVNVVVEAPQTITGSVIGLMELRNFSSITVVGVKNAYNAVLQAVTTENEVGATFTSNYANITGDIHNGGNAKLSATNVTGNIRNDAQMTIGGGSYVNGFITNDNNCLNCGKDKALLTIAGLTVNDLSNKDNVVVNGNLYIVSLFDNSGSVIVNEAGKVEGNEIENNGTVENKGSISVESFTNNKLINNYGYIKPINNFAEVNVYGTAEIDGLYNNEEAVLHVWSVDVHVVMAQNSCGTTILEGVDAQHVGYWISSVDQCPAELRVYRAYEEKTATSLKETYSKTLYDEIWTKYDIYFDVKWGSCGSFNRIKVEEGADVTFTVDNAVANCDAGYYELYKVTFEVAKKAVLNIENDSNFAIDKYEGKGEIHIGSGSSLGWGGPTNRKYQGMTVNKGYQQIIL